MTDEEIDAMEAGREMDAAVHLALYPRHNIETFENIDLLLWHHCDGEHEKGDSCRWKEIPHYSTDIGAAWLVVEKMNIIVWPLGTGTYKTIKGKVKAYGHGAPLAICRAALKATLNCHKITTTGTREPTEKTG